MRVPLFAPRSLLFILLAGCSQTGSSPKYGPDADAAPVNDACSAGEQTLLKLGCKDDRGRLIGGPNMHGVPWSQVCRSDKTNGVDLQPACISVATTCDQVMACHF